MKIKSLQEQFSEIGTDINKGIPHIVIGNPKVNKQLEPSLPEPKKEPINPLIQDKRDKLYDDIRHWAFISGIIIALTYAAYRIIMLLFFKQ